ncbi:GntR family transcriptional regulator [Planobispora takensis]|uniref:GntR family transcriptional regulator n=1 Tax=Planobispora takensis TaxID=1367882 RepID=A0A8J3WSY2_9ACTN|nr:GntR family transcriptional regulator [Planobispora takensis]GIH99767.1 GntR family transcriptional regulator [Planobispora takensis]
MIEFRLDRGSGVATYLQLVHQVRHALRLGTLRPGDRLPTAKEVVSRLAINPNTVLKAYRELEREGLVTGRPGLGTFVERSLGRTPPGERARLHGELVRWLRGARLTGLDEEDLRALFASALAEASQEEIA